MTSILRAPRHQQRLHFLGTHTERSPFSTKSYTEGLYCCNQVSTCTVISGVSRGGCFGCWSTPHARTPKKRRGEKRKRRKERKKRGKRRKERKKANDNEIYLSPPTPLNGFKVFRHRPIIRRTRKDMPNNLRCVCAGGGGGRSIFSPQKYRAYSFLLVILRRILRKFRFKKGLKLLLFRSTNSFYTRASRGAALLLCLFYLYSG